MTAPHPGEDLQSPAGGAATAPAEACPQCHKPPALCVCDGIVPIDNKVSLLILQHPQEQDRELGTARLTALHFKDALLKIGLSWPSLTKILGRQTDPQRWAILYLGSVKAKTVAPDREIVVVNKSDLQRARTAHTEIEQRLEQNRRDQRLIDTVAKRHRDPGVDELFKLISSDG